MQATFTSRAQRDVRKNWANCIGEVPATPLPQSQIPVSCKQVWTFPGIIQSSGTLASLVQVDLPTADAGF